MPVRRQPGTIVTDHRVEVPLDHAVPDGEHIEVFVREVAAAGKDSDRLPWLLFLQGGPGNRSPRPLGKDGWLGRALDDYRVLLLDQRGTGLSTPADRRTLLARGDAAAQADYLSHFRADSIVRDCEVIRRRLLGEDEPWSVLGQSFGGFCAVNYLSFAPDALSEVLITGGLPALRRSAEEVYRAAYPRIQRKNTAHYARYPEDIEAVRDITRHLRDRPAELPGGGALTPRAFQALGLMLGSSTGSHVLHYLVEDAFVTGPAGRVLSDSFLFQVQGHLSFTQNPLYALLHEASYGQASVSGQGTRWAAESVREEFPAFDADAALEGDGPVLFTGETIHPWMFETDPALAPLRETAELLAQREQWPDLYAPGRLADNQVPVAAAVYHDDMYVDTADSLETARAIRGLRTWVTDEYEHDGLRVSGGRVLDRLVRLVRGEL